MTLTLIINKNLQKLSTIILNLVKIILNRITQICHFSLFAFSKREAKKKKFFLKIVKIIIFL